MCASSYQRYSNSTGSRSPSQRPAAAFKVCASPVVISLTRPGPVTAGRGVACCGLQQALRLPRHSVTVFDQCHVGAHQRLQMLADERVVRGAEYQRVDLPGLDNFTLTPISELLDEDVVECSLRSLAIGGVVPVKPVKISTFVEREARRRGQLFTACEPPAVHL